LDVGASSEGNELEKSPLNSQTTLTSSETVEMEDISYAPPEKPVATKWAISNYDFDAEESNELSICSGQVVEVLQEKSNGWWLVSYDDKIGFAPSNYLEVINEEEALALIKEGAPKPANKDESKESKTAEDTKDSAKEMKKAREDEGYDEEVDEVFADFEMEHVTEQLISITSGDQKAEEKDVDPLAATLSSTVSLGAKLHCGYCNIELSPLDFYELDGVICCKDDLLKNFLKCFVCENHISGEHIVLAAGRLHLSCASCTVCNKTFSDPCEIQHKGSKLYCKSHYDELFGFECAHCNKIIEGQYLMALGKYWHLDHFRCFGACGKPLDGEYVVHEGKQYCMEDYKKSHAKKCALCNESIVTSALNAGELYYHSTCVKCDVCKHAYELGSNFFPEPLDGKSHHKFLCSTHYASKYLKPCSKCDLTIAAGEDRAFGDGRWWHPSCLKCDMCGKVVFNEQFFFSDKQILCMADYEKTHLEKCGICGKAITAKYASLLDMKVHIECVKCAVCDQLLVGTNLGVRQSKTTGKILCSEHFLAESAKKCHGCGNYIVKGGMLSVKDKTYHSECLVCEICKTNLKGKPFAVINDKLRCAEHAKSTAK
jgi:paxillin